MSEPELNIEYRPLVDLIPYARNSRTHDDEQVAQIAASIREFGWTNPILIDAEGVIIAGHGRVLAAHRLKLTEVPTITLGHLTEAQRRAYAIADNKLALNAGWDIDMLRVELGELNDLGFDIALTGFGPDEMSTLLAPLVTEGLTDEDAVPEPPGEPVSVPGDVWVLGNHRLICGDSTSIDVWDRLVPERADIIFTDPPYGMSYGASRSDENHYTVKKTGSARVKVHGMILGDDLRGESLIGLVRDAIVAAKAKSKEGAPIYACGTWRTSAEFTRALNEAGSEVKACIVWDKKSGGLGNSHYRPQHEFIFYCGGVWYGDRAQTDVWSMSRGATIDYVHPTQKPVELIERALQNSSKAGDVVLDCFGGSGSTMIAAEKTGRHARLVELDPKYVDTIVMRWQDFTGKSAVLEADGRTYTEVLAERKPGTVLNPAAPAPKKRQRKAEAA